MVEKAFKTERNQNKVKIHLLDIKTFYFLEKEGIELIAIKETSKLEKYIQMDNLMIEELHIVDYKLHQKLQKMTQKLKNKYWEVKSTYDIISKLINLRLLQKLHFESKFKEFVNQVQVFSRKKFKRVH
jgi:hypothetical protein